jgi:hypothetical protein
MNSGTQVNLAFSEASYHFLKSTLRDHSALIQCVKINPILKKELIDDINKVKITLKNAEQKGAV